MLLYDQPALDFKSNSLQQTLLFGRLGLCHESIGTSDNNEPINHKSQDIKTKKAI